MRLARAGEAAELAGVLLDAFEAYRPLYTPAAFAATTPSADQIRQRWDEGPVWIALQDGRAIGTVSAMPRVADLYMRSMAVVPESRGAGGGRALLAVVEAFAASHGHSRIVLSTTPFLADAIRLYERAGFSRVAEGPADLAGTPLFTLQKPVPFPRA